MSSPSWPAADAFPSHSTRAAAAGSIQFPSTMPPHRRNHGPHDDAPAQRHGEFVADLAAKRPALRKAQVMRIRRLAAANQTRLLGHESDMVAVANPARLGQGQGALVDRLGRTPCFLGVFWVRQRAWLRPRLTPVSVGPPWRRNVCQLRLERVLDPLGIGCGEPFFSASDRCAHMPASSLEVNAFSPAEQPVA